VDRHNPVTYVIAKDIEAQSIAKDIEAQKVSQKNRISIFKYGSALA
jgi:hypothetical protein